MARQNEELMLPKSISSSFSVPARHFSVVFLSTEELTRCAPSRLFEESSDASDARWRGKEAAEAREIAQKLLAALRDAYGDIWNFEVLLHCVRHMTEFAAVVDHGMPGAPKSSLPVSTVFGEIQGRFREALEFTILNWSFFAIVRALHKLVASRMTPECASYRDAMTANAAVFAALRRAVHAHRGRSKL